MPPFDEPWRQFLGSSRVDKWRRKASCLYAQGYQVYPEQPKVFEAFNVCPHDQLKVVIVGEAPYENDNADGLAFSVPDRERVPLALCNVLNEVLHNLDIAVSHDGNLARWARQGVLLLNSRLTIGQRPHSIRWGKFVDHVLEKISEMPNGVVFMLWGDLAHRRGTDIDNNRHLVLRSSHPSPKSAFTAVGQHCAFVGCGHFRRANEWLACRDIAEVNWS